MLITLSQFAGTAPRMDVRELQDSYGQTAELTRFTRGTLAPYKDLTAVATLVKTGPIKTIYRFGQNEVSDSVYWFHWAGEVSVLRSPTIGNTTERTYYFGDGRPKFTTSALMNAGGGSAYPTSHYILGLPRPIAPLVVVTPNPSPSPDDEPLAERRVYSCSYTSIDGKEGPLSPASAAVDVYPGDTVTVALPPAPVDGVLWHIDNTCTKRLYCVGSGTTSSEYLLVADAVPMATTSYVDGVAAPNRGRVANTADWEAPPSDLSGAALMPNGIIVGWKRNELWMCEPYVTHAFPSSYTDVVDSEIVGIAVAGQTAIIGTKGAPYLLTGPHPMSMSLERLDIPQACVSRRSMVAVRGGVVYASPDGLVFVQGRIGTVVTQELFSRADWQALTPSSMHCAVHDDALYMFYQTSGGSSGGYVFNFLDDGMSAVKITRHYTAAYSDPVTDHLYLCGSTDLAGAAFASSTTVARWDAASNVSYTWRSKEFVLPSRKTFTAAKVVATNYPVTLRLYTDRTLRATKTVASNKAFRLPTGYECEEVSVEVLGTASVNKVFLAESMDELRRS